MRASIQRGICQVQRPVQQGVKAAELAFMRDRRAGNVIGHGAQALRFIQHLRSRHVEEIPHGASMKRRTSQGQAMRSILGRSRVIQREGCSPVTPQSGRLAMVGGRLRAPLGDVLRRIDAVFAARCRRPGRKHSSLRPATR
jgi:hypothetical protein